MKTKTRRPPRKNVLAKSRAARTRKQLDNALTELQRAELVRPLFESEAAFLLKHALVQDTALSTLLRGEYKRLNLLVAQAYEKIYPAQTLNEFAAVLAQHYDAAGDDAKTFDYALRAGDNAARVYANTEAIAFYTQALDAAKRVNAPTAQLIYLYTKRGRVHELLGNYDLALGNYDEMENLARLREDRALELAALMARATVHSLPNARFDKAQAHALSQQSLALARELDDQAAQAKILWNLMLRAHFSGKPDEAIAYGEQSIALARALNLREQLAYALNDSGRSYLIQRQFPEGMQHLREAQTLWRELDNKPMLADNLNTMATTFSTLGQVEEGLALAAEAYQLGCEIHNPWTMAHSCMTRAAIHIERGEFAIALTLLQECLELAQRAGFQIGLASAKMLSALVYVELGDAARALEVVNAKADQSNDLWRANRQGVLALVLIALGALAEARDAIRAGNATHTSEPPNPFVGSVLLLAEARLAFAEKDYARTVAVLDEKFERIAANTLRSIHVATMLLKAQALAKQGMLDNAFQIAQAVHVQAEQFQSRRFLWQIYALLGELAQARGDDAQAAAHYAEAREILEYIAAHAPEENRASFLNLPDVRAVIAL